MFSAAIERWRAWHRGPWLYRWPLKVALFLAVAALTVYPRLDYLPTWLYRLRDMNSVLDPQHPGLAPLEAEVRAVAAAEGVSDPHDVLRIVEQVVYDRVPYAFDWETWGVMDYLPTVDEVLALGREDCDGRAVVAASLLRRMGHHAWLVNDILHTWVATREGETMGPSAGEQTLVATEHGTAVHLSPGLIQNLANGFAFGVTVFPLSRQLVIMAALALLSLQPRSSRARRVCGVLLLIGAPVVAQTLGERPEGGGEVEQVWVWTGVAMLLCGWLLLVVTGAARGPRSVAAPPESRAAGGASRG